MGRRPVRGSVLPTEQGTKEMGQGRTIKLYQALKHNTEKQTAAFAALFKIGCTEYSSGYKIHESFLKFDSKMDEYKYRYLE
jgi:hypothetical protein